MAFLWEAVELVALEEVEVVQGEEVVTLRSPEFEDHLQLFESVRALSRGILYQRQE